MTPRVRFQREEKKEKKRRGRCYAFSEPVQNAQNAQNVAQVTQHEDIKIGDHDDVHFLYLYRPVAIYKQTEKSRIAKNPFLEL